MNRSIAVAVLVTAACGDATAPTPASIVGDYGLTAVDTHAVPYVVEATAEESTTVVWGAAGLTAGTYTYYVEMDVVVQIAPGHWAAALGAYVSDSGSFALSGNTLSLHSAFGHPDATATVRGNVLTLADVKLFSTDPTRVSLEFQRDSVPPPPSAPGIVMHVLARRGTAGHPCVNPTSWSTQCARASPTGRHPRSP